MLLPDIAAPLPRATFHVKIVSQACRVAPSGDVSCLNCSPSVSCGTLGRHFMLLLFPERAAPHPRATFHALIVPQACRVTPSGDVLCFNVPRACRVELLGDISCFYCSPSVSCDTLERHFIPLSFLKGIARHSRATFHALIVPQACRVTPSGDVSCLNCSPSIPCGTLG